MNSVIAVVGSIILTLCLSHLIQCTTTSVPTTVSTITSYGSAAASSTLTLEPTDNKLWATGSMGFIKRQLTVGSPYINSTTFTLPDSSTSYHVLFHGSDTYFVGNLQVYKYNSSTNQLENWCGNGATGRTFSCSTGIFFSTSHAAIKDDHMWIADSLDKKFVRIVMSTKMVSYQESVLTPTFICQDPFTEYPDSLIVNNNGRIQRYLLDESTLEPFFDIVTLSTTIVGQCSVFRGKVYAIKDHSIVAINITAKTETPFVGSASTSGSTDGDALTARLSNPYGLTINPIESTMTIAQSAISFRNVSGSVFSTCFEWLPGYTSVCAGHGTCLTSQLDQCQCNTGYYGPRCIDHVCFGEIESDPSVCSGHGSCVSNDTCLCQTGYSNSHCSCTCDSVGAVSVDCSIYGTCSCRDGYSGSRCEVAANSTLETKLNSLQTQVSQVDNATYQISDYLTMRSVAEQTLSFAKQLRSLEACSNTTCETTKQNIHSNILQKVYAKNAVQTSITAAENTAILATLKELSSQKSLMTISSQDTIESIINTNLCQRNVVDNYLYSLSVLSNLVDFNNNNDTLSESLKTRNKDYLHCLRRILVTQSPALSTSYGNLTTHYIAYAKTITVDDMRSSNLLVTINNVPMLYIPRSIGYRFQNSSSKMTVSFISYPSANATEVSQVFEINFYINGQEIPVNNLPQTIAFQIPMLPSLQQDNDEKIYTCKYLAGTYKWSDFGVISGSADFSTRMFSCETFHLTSFAVFSQDKEKESPRRLYIVVFSVIGAILGIWCIYCCCLMIFIVLMVCLKIFGKIRNKISKKDGKESTTGVRLTSPTELQQTHDDEKPISTQETTIELPVQADSQT